MLAIVVEGVYFFS